MTSNRVQMRWRAAKDGSGSGAAEDSRRASSHSPPRPITSHSKSTMLLVMVMGATMVASGLILKWVVPFDHQRMAKEGIHAQETFKNPFSNRRIELEHRDRELNQLVKNPDVSEDKHDSKLQKGDEVKQTSADVQSRVEAELSGCSWDQHIVPPVFSDSSVRPNRPWFVVAIPTVPRATPHLSETLASIAQQLPPDSPFVRVVVVHNIKPSQNPSPVHEAFNQEKQARAGDQRFIFIEQINALEIIPGEEIGNANFPGARVRAQTRDLVATLRATHEATTPEYLLFMEDDFNWCSQAFETFVYMIRRLNAMLGSGTHPPQGKPGWNLIRFSFGFNGVILHGEDVPILANYLLEHQSRRPPDHLLVEWFAGEKPQSAAQKRGRAHAAYRYNLLDHQGTISTLRSGTHPSYVKCWRPLVYPINFEVEVFKESCMQGFPEEDLWPCQRTPECGPWPHMG